MRNPPALMPGGFSYHSCRSKPPAALVGLGTRGVYGLTIERFTYRSASDLEDERKTLFARAPAEGRSGIDRQAGAVEAGILPAFRRQGRKTPPAGADGVIFSIAVDLPVHHILGRIGGRSEIRAGTAYGVAGR